MEEQNARIHLFITGKVQGVFFRLETQKAAQKIGVKGWVRNRTNGKVEAVFEGKHSKILDIIKWCRKGSYMSKVENLEIKWEEFSGGFSKLDILPTI